MMARRQYTIVDVCLICLCVAVCETKRSYVFKMPGSYCNFKRREIDGALIRSSSNPLYTNNACTLKFKADSHRFWINFESWLVTDCNLKLKLYYTQSYTSLMSSTYYNTPDVVFDCHSNPGSYISPGRYLTMRLEKRTNTGYSFKIVLTSFKEKSNWSCPKSHCGNDMMCVDRDVWCDGVRNCPNGTDETNCNLYTARRRNSGGMLLGGILMLVGMVIVALVLLVWCRRRRATRGQVLDPPPGGYTMQQHTLYQQQPMTTAMPGVDRTMPPPQPPMFPMPAPMPTQTMGGPPMYPPAGMPPQVNAPYPPQGPPPPYESITQGPVAPPYS
ncbi:hypothetical protein LSAT2_000484 [Lamellibrachia satsuma]|nr:hypothetical protein LSAT2_000484 [Lamellibrachia satsuma]